MKIFELLEDRSDITQTSEFKRWFGNSKVVDGQGKPLVVYHGTSRNFSTFELNKAGSTSGVFYFGKGFYFTRFASSASNYAGRKAGDDGGWHDVSGGNIIPVYLSLQNPLNLSDDANGRIPANTIRALNKALVATGGDKISYGISADYVMEELGERAEEAKTSYSNYGATFSQSLINQGFDGVIFYEGEEIVAFRPEQIKSATGNNGKFDPNNPDITKEELNESVNVPGSNNTLPPEPGSTPIPNGTVRLYHQTDEKNLESIANNGLNIQYARGIEGPRAIYASETGFYGNPEKTPTVEFYVDIDKWDDPFVLQDVPSEQIIAVHYPWHKLARYILNHQDTLKNTLNGEFDDLEGDYAKAVEYVKNKFNK